MHKVDRGLLTGYLEYKRLKKISQNILNDETILDVGCGIGKILSHISQYKRYVGIDIQREQIELAKKRYRNSGEFILTDIIEENPDIGRFSAIIMVASIEHLEEPDETIKMLKSNYLKRQGRILLTTPSPHGRKIHEIGAKIGFFSKHAAEEHNCFFDRTAIEKIAKSADLTLSRYETFLFGFNQFACLTSTN